MLSAATDTLYVNANNTSPGDGSSWSNAFDDLQDAIDISNANGGGLHIWVAAGTYHPTFAVDTDGMNGAEPRERTFYITQPVEVYGGFTSGQTMLSQRDSLGGTTILTGALSGSGTDTAYHVVTLVADAIGSDWRLDGLTIRDGRATATAISHISGAGIYVPYRQARIFTPVIQNCVITNNIAKGNGGGIYASVYHNTFTASSENRPTIISCSISDNMANLGAGIYLFSDAVSSFNASAVSSPIIANSVLFHNISTDEGGGVYNMAKASAQAATIGTVNANAVSSPTIINSTLYKNTAISGGGMFLNSSAIATTPFGVATADEITNPSIYNTILWGNTAYSLSNGLDISKNNSNNSHPNGTISHSTLSFELSVNGTISYTDTLVQDPMFMSTLSGADGLRLQSTSPAINKGDNAQATEISHDLLGNPRVRQDTVDMGAYEGLSCAVPDTLYVNVNNVNPTAPADGSSWASALTDLQEAIDISNACAGNKEIWVAKGTYRTTFVYDLDNNGIVEDLERTFYITHPLQIYGGFDGNEVERHERDSLGQETILTAAQSGLDTAYHVMFMTADSITSDWVIDGLQIEYGRARSNSITNRFGGGLYARSTIGDMKPTIKNCSFTNNDAQQGGGIYFQTNNTANQELTSPQLINCTFTENSAGQGGGVLFSGNTIHSNFSNCNFSENSAANGGGISSKGTINKSYFSNCNFTDNTASISGGGIHVSGGNDNNQELINCVFINNSASRGGGLFSSSFSSSPQVVNTTFSGNSAVNGGGIYVVGHTTSHPQLTNCIFWENEVTGASIEGPDIWINRSDNAKISHSIVTEAGLHVEDASGTIDTMTVFLHDDPMFANAMSNDLRLLPNSPAMNAGINDSIPDGISTDLDGNPRIRFGTVDMGAYEGVPCISSDTLYVDIDNTTPAVPADGSSWTAALTDLQEAIDISNACEGGKEIWIAKGTYHPTFVNDLNGDGDREDRERTFYITHPVQIYGGFEGDELERHERDSLGQRTILTAAQSGRDTAYHVMFMKADSITSDWVIDGLRIKDGRAFGNTPTNQQGGGLFTESLLEAMNLTIKNSFFENNLTLKNGGGIYIWSKTSAQPYISRCNFSNNSANRGGGIYIEASKAIPNFSDCIFYSNSADISGGGVYVGRSTPQPLFNNCSFENNTAGFSGGGIYSEGQYLSSPELTSCRFTNNSSKTGGAVWVSAESFSKPKLTNCTMTKNLADEDGGAIYVSAGDVIPHLTNSTIVNNVANRNGGGIFIRSWSETSPQVTNCILWNNSAAGQSSLGTDIYLNTSNNSKISHSIVTSGGIYIDDGSAIDTMTVYLHDDPMLVDTMNNDLRLLPTSPAINAGINDSIPDSITTDLLGNPRVRQNIVDVGAYEGISCAVPDTLYVNVNNTNPAAPADGSSWASALTNLQEAIDLSNACGGGKEIWLAKGTYRPTFVNDLDEDGIVEDQERTFYITHPVQIYGGFDGNEIERSERDSLSEETTLTAAHPDKNTAYHVMFMIADSITSDWIIDGLIITEGRALGSDLIVSRGGGLYAQSTIGDMQATIKNCSFINNAAFEGGGIYFQTNNKANQELTSPQLINCTFTDNFGGVGGGISFKGNTISPQLSHSNFYENSAFNGGGISINGSISKPHLSYCNFVDNEASGSGGGIYARVSNIDSSHMINCSFSNNTADNGGGVYMNSRLTAIPQLTNCTFTNNSAATAGGGIYTRASEGHPLIVGQIPDPDDSIMDPVIKSCIFSNNSAQTGGGIYINGTGTVNATGTNCMITNNSAQTGGGVFIIGTGTVNATGTNCTITNNSADRGGGVFVSNFSVTVITFPRSTNINANSEGGIFDSSSGTNLKITNSIIWANQTIDASSEGPDIWINRSANSKISHSIVTFGGIHIDDGSAIDTMTVFLHDDPMLVDSMNNDLRLLPNSPAINAGINDSIPDGITTDLDGLDRINCDIVDMGAYEFQRPLELVCAGPITVNTDMGTCTILKTNPIFTPPTANCGIASVENDMPDELALGTTTVTWTVTDTDGRQASCMQEVTVVDNQAPTITCLADLTIDADAGSCMASGITLGMPSASDNCMVESITNDAPQDGIYNIGETMVRWIVTDAAGLKDTCFQKVTVVDNQAPTITCLADLTIDADAGSCTASGITLGMPSASDNCMVESITNNAPQDGIYNTGETMVRWIVADVAGLKDTCFQKVTVVDNQAPTITCAADLTIDADAGSCTASGITLGMPSASDNCMVESITNNAPQDGIYNIGEKMVRWIVTDAAGLKDTCFQKVTVVDNQAPTITCLADLTIDADAGSCMASGIALGMPNASDNCMVESITNNVPQDGIYNIGETMVRWIVTDAAGLKDTCFQKVTVVDNQAPTITCAPDTTITTTTNIVLNSPAISDNCTGELTLENNAPTVFVAAITTVTWTVTDVAGNMNTCDQLVTLDATDPCEEDIIIDQSPGGKIIYSTDMNIFLNLLVAPADTLLLSHGVSTQANPGFQVDSGGILEIRNDGCID